MATLTKQHPSQRLQHGEISSFLEAMVLYQDQMRHENEMTKQLAAEGSGRPLTDLDREFMKRLSDCAADAGEAYKIYCLKVREAEKAVIAELRAKNTDTFKAFADALESGNYSQLAI